MEENCCNKKLTERSETEIKELNNRLNRVIGQLNGIKAMINDNRYCKDVLLQVAACEKALQSFGYQILQEHLSSCVTTKIKNGDLEIIDETMDIIRKINGL